MRKLSPGELKHLAQGLFICLVTDPGLLNESDGILLVYVFNLSKFTEGLLCAGWRFRHWGHSHEH